MGDGEWLMGVGIVLVIIGPLLNLPLIWLLHRFLAYPWLQRLTLDFSPRQLKLLSLAMSTALLAGFLFATTLPGRFVFEDLCDQYGTPMVSERHFVESYYARELFPYEAARILRETGFRFVEAPDPYQPEKLLRYSLGTNHQLVTEEITSVVSQFEVHRHFSEHGGGTHVMRAQIFERGEGRQIASAASITFDGGPLSLLMGTQVMAHCPDILSAEGSEHFRIFYSLEQHVLRFEG